MRGFGTVINVAAVILGGGLGILLKGGLKKRYQEIMMQALGVCTIFIGLSGALKGMFSVENGALETSGTMLLIGSLVAGALLGEWIQIEKWMDHFGEWLRRKVGGKNDSQFVEGFVSASLVICVGAMAIVGALEDGMRGDYSMLAAKAVLDAGIVLVFCVGVNLAFGKRFRVGNMLPALLFTVLFDVLAKIL
ncbi:DUF554 domain-containing protein [Faecalicatena sp. AGMB00832]|uniref:DUF554 domain-containing protein n=1 Tax=Faecalicatena faecalis TaxID=2726362 RepID=A0ABS6D0G1_9FIRM|nr:DUF554 family protein [Faecalicatena faecalis]MBU3874996.1 DUF554 domain-containing protein [Faecalicatena faecalis]